MHAVGMGVFTSMSFILVAELQLFLCQKELSDVALQTLKLLSELSCLVANLCHIC